MRGVIAPPNFIGNDTTGIPGLRQEPGMVEAWGGAGRVAVPADSRIRDELVDLAFDRQAERCPAKYAALCQPGAIHHPNILRVRIPFRPLRRVNDMLPDTLARRIDDDFV